jgi:hypothetical protein
MDISSSLALADRVGKGSAHVQVHDALAAVDDPTPGKQALQRLTTTKKDATGRSCPGFNPMAQHDATLFKSLMAGEHGLHGFTNRHIRSQLNGTRYVGYVPAPMIRRRPAQRSAAASGGRMRTDSSPRSRAPDAGRVTDYGRKVMATTMYLREHRVPNVESGVMH